MALGKPECGSGGDGCCMAKENGKTVKIFIQLHT